MCAYPRASSNRCARHGRKLQNLPIAPCVVEGSWDARLMVHAACLRWRGLGASRREYGLSDHGDDFSHRHPQ